VTANFESGKTLCLLNENAQCNAIWVSQPDGLRLAHFQTFQRELTRQEHESVRAAYETCVRHCLLGRDHFQLRTQ
jgi:hypothetical protein